MTVNSAKRTTAVTSKMDVFVPSPGPFATSPPSSIYEQERPDLGNLCTGSSLSHPSADSVISDDLGGLDDHLEDSPLETLLTQDVMNTLNLQAPGMNTPPEFSWGGKLDNDTSLPTAVETLGPNPTLAQLNMEPDMSFVNLLNMDQDDCKFNYSALDFMCNDINSTNQSSLTNVSAISTGPLPSFVSRCIDSQRCSETISSSSVELGKKNFSDLGNSYIRTTASVKSNFPPRTTQPQLVGIVPPVMKLEPEESTVYSEKADDGLGKLKAQSPNLHKLLSKQPIKSEITTAPDTQKSKSVTGNAFSDMSVQIVPSSGTNKRTHADTFKMEPLSPESFQKPLVKEESTEDKWKDIEHFMHSPGEEPAVKKRRRYDSGSSSHISDDDDDEDDISSHGGKDVEYDSDDDYSDIDADLAHITPSNCESLVAMGKKQKQYFWQYNVQSKGPKGTRLKLAVDSPTDPHVLNDFEDPVFDECNTAIAGIRHGGKARKGDGNEITPNPRKLFMIGHQLMRLTRQINACQLGADVPAAKRNESRKEKNKLASRACRLKKKAQHEANKIKLYGLEQEHSELNSVLRYIWPHLKLKAKALLGQSDKSEVLSSTSVPLRDLLEARLTQNQKSRVAGHTTDYVNSVILNVESGDNSGGLNIKKSHKT